MSVVAQHEREAIAKERGTVLGGYRGGPVICSAEGGEATKQAADAFAALVGPTVLDRRRQDDSLASIATSLTAQGIKTARNRTWTSTTVRNVLARLDQPTG